MTHPLSPDPARLPTVAQQSPDEPELLVPMPSVRLVPTPDLAATFADFLSKVQEAVAIPAEFWPPGRSVTLHIDVALVPVGLSVTIDNKAE